MGTCEKGQPSPADQPEVSYAIFGYDLHHFLPVYNATTKTTAQLAEYVLQARLNRATLITIRVITPLPFDQHQQEALFT